MLIRLRPLTREDYELVMAWRSHPDVYAGNYTQDHPLAWREHVNWVMNRPADSEMHIISLSEEGLPERRAGGVNLCNLNTDEPEVGIYIGDTTLWGRGVAKQALCLTANYLEERGYRFIRASIKDGHERSERLFTSLGYVLIGAARAGESRYRKELRGSHDA